MFNTNRIEGLSELRDNFPHGRNTLHDITLDSDNDGRNLGVISDLIGFIFDQDLFLSTPILRKCQGKRFPFKEHSKKFDIFQAIVQLLLQKTSAKTILSTDLT